MTTVKQDVLAGRKASIAHRLSELKRLTAPQMVIDRCAADLAKVEATVSFKGDFEVPFSAKETKKGRGGKPYVVYTTDQGEAFYFPNGQYGAFCKWGKD